MRTILAAVASLLLAAGAASAYQGNGSVGTNQFQEVPGGVGCGSGCVFLFGGVGYGVYVDEASKSAYLCLSGFAEGARFDTLTIDTGFGVASACASVDPSTGVAYFGADATEFRRSDTAGVPLGLDSQHAGAHSDGTGTGAAATGDLGAGLPRWANWDVGAETSGGVTCAHAVVVSYAGPVIVGPFCP